MVYWFFSHWDIVINVKYFNKHIKSGCKWHSSVVLTNDNQPIGLFRFSVEDCKSFDVSKIVNVEFSKPISTCNLSKLC